MWKSIVRTGIVLAIAGALSATTTSAMAAESTPPDVQDAYSAQALSALRASQQTTVDAGNVAGQPVPDFSAAATFGAAHQIHTWSDAMIAGDTSAVPTTATEEWLATVLTAKGNPLGTYRVWRPAAGNTAEMAGYNNDLELARAIVAMPADAILVNDAPSGEWLSIEDSTVSALNQVATFEVPSPMSVADYTPIISERYAAAVADAADRDGAVGGGGPREDRRPWDSGMNPWILLLGTIALVGGAAIGITIVVRHRREKTTHADRIRG
jgi:hypothetical protein